MNWTAEQVREFFRAHWTVRKYKSVLMPSEHLDAILYAAQRAPTDATAQMYSFVRLVDPALRKKISEISTNAHIAQSSEAFIVCADVHRLAEVLKTENHQFANIPNIAMHFAIGDAVMAGENMLIAAEMLGYRGCWIGGVMNALNEIAELIKLPKGVVPFAGLTIGVPDEAHVARPRLPRHQVIHENEYKDASSEDLKKGIQEMAAITARGNWAQTLARYFAKGGTMEEREKVLSEFLKKTL
jgi:FMN reductase (NADPH)